jgi:hypothetical protein
LGGKGPGINYGTVIKHTENIVRVLHGNILVISVMAILHFDSTTQLLHFTYHLAEHTVLLLNTLCCNFRNNLDCDISYSLPHQNNFILHFHVTVAY